jgi:hypothetical protein
MRLLLFILGVLVAIVLHRKARRSGTKPPLVHQWCINKPDESPQCRYATNNAWPIDLARARLVHLVRTRRHRKHIHQTGPRGAERLRLAQKLRQLRVRRASRKRDGICGGVIRSCARG